MNGDDGDGACLYADDIDVLLLIIEGGKDNTFLGWTRRYIERKLERPGCNDSEWDSWISTTRNLPYQVLINYLPPVVCMLSSGVYVAFSASCRLTTDYVSSSTLLGVFTDSRKGVLIDASE